MSQDLKKNGEGTRGLRGSGGTRERCTRTPDPAALLPKVKALGSVGSGPIRIYGGPIKMRALVG